MKQIPHPTEVRLLYFQKATKMIIHKYQGSTIDQLVNGSKMKGGKQKQTLKSRND